jgi:DNA-binding NtrC family response regulator
MSDKKYNILCVDDEYDLNDMLRDTFELEGFTVTCASNGEEALLAISNQKFDAVVSDQCMPGIGGGELLKKINSAVSEMPLFYLCTGNSELIKEDLRGHGLTSIIEKPYDVFNLAEIINKKLSEKIS